MPQILTTIAFAAGVGGSAPTLIALAQGLTRQPADVPTWAYYAGVLIYFALGSAVAIIFGETDAKKAFFLGVSLPALLVATQTQAGLSKANQPPATTRPQGASQSGEGFHIIPRAFAQGPSGGASGQDLTAPAPQGAERKLSLTPNRSCQGCELWFFDRNGNVVDKKPLFEHDKSATYGIPRGAESFGIWNESINANRWSLPSKETGTYQYEFDYKRKIMNDLKRGLGDYSVKPYDLHVEKKSPSSRRTPSIVY